MTANNRPADCVCNCSGHCRACLAAGIVCDRPGCANVRSDGKPCPGRVPPPPPSGTRRAPAMPEPELVDDAPTPRVCTTSDGLIDALRASTEGPGARALATALARPFDADHVPGKWRMPLDECRARAAKARASTESRPARALTLDDLDAHERARYARRRA